MNLPCMDCGVNTSPSAGGAGVEEYYMVSDELWTFGDGFLCIGCLEKRIGRRLVLSDFIIAAVNTDTLWPRSDRLKDRCPCQRRRGLL